MTGISLTAGFANGALAKQGLRATKRAIHRRAPAAIVASTADGGGSNDDSSFTGASSFSSSAFQGAPKSSMAARLLAQSAAKTSATKRPSPTKPAAKKPSAKTKASAKEAKAAKEPTKMTAEETAVRDAKKKALDRVLGEIDANFGKGSIMKLGEAGQAKVATFPSGAMTLDLALGGGLPRGRIVEVYGPESSGKTTLALHAMAEMQKIGGTVALIDAEHAFDPEYSQRLGLNVDDVVVCQPETGEMGLEVVDTLVRSSAVDLIVVDSVAALVPRSEIEGEIGMVQVGAHARLMSQALRKINVNAAKAGVTIIFLNQLRSKVGVIYGNPEITTGGNALKFYASVRLDIRRKEIIRGKAGADDEGVRVKCKVAKNKIAPPYKTAEFDMMFGLGISRDGCMLDAADELDVITRRGAWYSYGEERLGQGRAAAMEFFDANPEIKTQIEADVRRTIAERLAGTYGVKPNDPSDAKSEPVLGAFAGASGGGLFEAPAAGEGIRDGMEDILDFDEDEEESAAR